MRETTRYDIYVLLSALSGAAGITLVETLLRTYAVSALDITLVANAVGGCLLLGVAASQGTDGWRGWPISDWVRLLLSSAMIFAAGFLLFYESIDRIGASKATVLGRLELLFIVALAVIFLREPWGARHWLASALAITGGVLVNFDPLALDLHVGAGEMFIFLSAFVFAAGIVLLKSLVDRQDGLIVTGYGLAIGAVLLAPIVFWQHTAHETSSPWGWILIAALLFRGALLGISWVTYNIAMEHLGASRASVLFLSVVLFTVILQVAVDALAPDLGMRLPQHMVATLCGAALICAAVALIHRTPTLKETST